MTRCSQNVPEVSLNLRTTTSEPEKLIVLFSDLLITETENQWAVFHTRELAKNTNIYVLDTLVNCHSPWIMDKRV